MTPIIAVLILLLITMAMGVTVWSFVSIFGEASMIKVTIPFDGVSCYDCANGGGEILVMLTNTGVDDLIPSNEDLICKLDGQICTDVVGGGNVTWSSVAIKSSKQGVGLRIAGASPGSHTIMIGSGSSTTTDYVTCNIVE